MRLSPQDPQFFAMRTVVALGHYLAGRHDAAYQWAQAAMREKSNFLLAAGTAAASAALAGRPDEAARAMDRLRQLNPELRLANLGDWLVFQRLEDIGAWTDGLRKSGLPE